MVHAQMLHVLVNSQAVPQRYSQHGGLVVPGSTPQHPKDGRYLESRESPAKRVGIVRARSSIYQEWVIRIK